MISFELELLFFGDEFPVVVAVALAVVVSSDIGSSLDHPFNGKLSSPMRPFVMSRDEMSRHNSVTLGITELNDMVIPITISIYILEASIDIRFTFTSRSLLIMLIIRMK